ncbi:N(4)-(Beta-N-acetylglucosaminyl)-L-asparaginase isoform X5 [Cetorhinus maximus]
MAAVGTWAFSLAAVERVRRLMAAGNGATHCVQEAMAELENDKETGCFVVGRGGFPNKAGVVQCDAAIMEGLPGRFGAVAALPGVGIPLTVARVVMDKNTHNMLVGEGAAAFAKEQGFSIEDNNDMMSEAGLDAYEVYLLLELHSKILDVLVTRLCLDVDCMQTIGQELLLGLSPADACQSVIQDICHRVGKKDIFEIGLIALNMKGEVGAASTVSFPYTFWARGMEAAEQRQSNPHTHID